MQQNYRSDIDGLRGLAVLSVVFFHSSIKPFEINFFSGGYLGVDIFFIISGYLITNIILYELKKNNEFNYLTFFERRSRRILPILFFAIIISLPLSYFVLSPTSLLDYSKSIFSAIFFYSNIRFISTDYYDFEAILKPLLHTWSLSVEAQYYFLYPFFLVFLFKNFKKYIIIIFLILIFCSLFYSNFLSSIDPSKNFYILTSRIWELFIGSIISIVQLLKPNKNKTYTYLQNFYSIFGISLILISIFNFNNQTPHPSFLTLIPVTGVVLVIYFSNQKYLATKILSNSLLTKTGLISYSFYIWHFIFFSLGKHGNFYFDKVSKKHILLILILSIFTYFFIEKPFRNRKFISFKKFLIIIFIAFSFIATSATFLINNYDKKNSQFKTLNEFIKSQIPKTLSIENKPCFASIDFCEYISNKDNKYVIIVGDSILEGITPSLKDELLSKGYNFISMNNSLCYFIPEFNSVIGDRQRIASNQICDYKYQELRLKKILSLPNSIIILGGLLPFENFQHYKNKKTKFEKKYLEYIDKLLANNYKIIQLVDILSYPENISEFLEKLIFRKQIISSVEKFKLNINLTISEKEFLENNKDQYALFDKIKNKNYVKISNKDIFCNKIIINECSFNDEEHLFIVDHLHYSNKGAQLISEKIINEIENFEKK